MTRPIYLTSILLACAVLFSCASAKKRFEQGLELEQEGRYVEAANRYIQSLERDSNQPDVRERLVLVGPDAVGMLLDAAGTHTAAREPVEAAGAFIELDNLVAGASRVGVDLALPDDHDNRRTAAMEKAVEALEAAGRAAEQANDWSEAVGFYDRIVNYEPTSAQLEQAEASAIRALLDWARADLDRGQFMAVVERTDAAIERIGGPDAPGVGAALDLRQRAIELGTVFVAFTPVWDDAEGDEDVSTDFLEELNDFLEIEFWSRPPLMVASADPLVVRREVRRLGYNRSSLSPAEAARVGRRVEADLVLIGEVTRLTIEERNVRERTRSARTKNGETLAYVVRQGDLRYEAEIEIELVETSSRRVLERGRIRENESGKFEHAIFDGDYRDLNLSRDERRLFDEDRWRDQELEIEDQLIEDLAANIAEEAFEDIVRRLR